MQLSISRAKLPSQGRVEIQVRQLPAHGYLLPAGTEMNLGNEMLQCGLSKRLGLTRARGKCVESFLEAMSWLCLAVSWGLS